MPGRGWCHAAVERPRSSGPSGRGQCPPGAAGAHITLVCFTGLMHVRLGADVHVCPLLTPKSDPLANANAVL